MKWSILILTMPQRKEFLHRLQQALYPQIEKLPDVEIIVRTSDPSLTLGENRQAMLNSAAGEYVNFIDDDDMVAKNYVASIYPLLKSGVDYIGFPVKVFRDGTFIQTAYHSLQYKGWTSHGDVAFRDISHLNPMRKELALQVSMSGGYGEDHRWATQLREKQIIKTQKYVPEAMYFYYMRTKKQEMTTCA
jgi:hypothetical protein